MSDKQLAVIEQREVEFYDDQITAVRVEDGTVYVPIRPICDLLGIDRRGQQQRIDRDPVLSELAQSITVVLSGGVTPPQGRSMVCLPLDHLNGWLFGINANRVKAEVRDSVIRYQKECYRVLFEAFQSGELSADNEFNDLLKRADSEAVEAYQMLQALTKLARSHVILSARVDSHETRLSLIEARLGDSKQHVTSDQAARIQAAVKSIAHEMSKNSGRNQYGAVWNEFYRRFDIPDYRSLPTKRFDEALHFLSDWYSGITDDEGVPF